MNTEQIVKSWKDEDYAHALSTAEQALLPENPVGLMELSEEDLLGINGGVAVTVTITITIAIALITI